MAHELPGRPAVTGQLVAESEAACADHKELPGLCSHCSCQLLLQEGLGASHAAEAHAPVAGHAEAAALSQAWRQLPLAHSPALRQGLEEPLLLRAESRAERAAGRLPGCQLCQAAAAQGLQGPSLAAPYAVQGAAGQGRQQSCQLSLGLWQAKNAAWATAGARVCRRRRRRRRATTPSSSCSRRWRRLRLGKGGGQPGQLQRGPHPNGDAAAPSGCKHCSPQLSKGCHRLCQASQVHIGLITGDDLHAASERKELPHKGLSGARTGGEVIGQHLQLPSAQACCLLHCHSCAHAKLARYVVAGGHL